MMKRFSAVITIYLSLILLLSGALVFTLVESARISALKTNLREITYMAADSVFSEFAQPVFDDYGVMMIWDDAEQFRKEFSEYAQQNLSNDMIRDLLQPDLYKARLEETTLIKMISPTDNDGKAFTQQALDYTKTFLPMFAAQHILSSSSIFEQGDKVSAFMDTIESYGEVFKKVEQSVSKVKEKMDKVRSIADEPSTYLEQAYKSVKDYKAGNTSALSSFNSAMSKLKSSKEKLTKEIKDVKKATDDYYQAVEKAKDACDQLEGQLQVDKEEFDPDIYPVVEEQVQDLRQKSADTDYDYYLVGKSSDNAAECVEQLESLDSLFEQTQSPLTKENAGQYESLLASYRENLSSFDPESLAINLDTGTTEKEDSSFISEIEKLFGSGLLGFIAGDVSDKEIDTSILPSKTHGSSSESAASGGNYTGQTSGSAGTSSFEDTSGTATDSTLGSGSASDSAHDAGAASDSATGSGGGHAIAEGGSSYTSTPVDNALLGEYVLQSFGNCARVNAGEATVSPDPALDYEAEYVIAGKASDKDNLAVTVSEIVLLRTGCNLISILKSAEKKAATFALASSCVGFTGMPIVIKVFQILIIAAWALAESIVDVKALIEGHKITTIKNDSDWYLSLAGIKNFGQDAISTSGNEKGLSYESYLRLLLLLKSKKTLSFRSMDLIQANMCKNENEDFRIEDCITAVSVKADYSCPQIFTTFPFVKKLLPEAGGQFGLSITQNYTY